MLRNVMWFDVLKLGRSAEEESSAMHSRDAERRSAWTIPTHAQREIVPGHPPSVIIFANVLSKYVRSLESVAHFGTNPQNL